MTALAGPALPPGFDVTMFRSSQRLSRGLALLRALPGPLSVGLLAAAAILDGVWRGRYAQARRWASALGCNAVGGHWLALRLLANHGRFVAQEAMLGWKDPGEWAGSVTVRGGEHLRAARSGVLLLGFHLGPPLTWLMLRARGIPVRMAARFNQTGTDPRWTALANTGDIIPLPEHDPAGRLQALYRIGTLLARNASIFMTADGPLGREVFRLDLPGTPLVVRGGWFAVRRQTRVPTLPVLAHEEAGQIVVEIHPPLPDVAADVDADAAACRAALTPLVRGFVERHPEQCRYLAFPW